MVYEQTSVEKCWFSNVQTISNYHIILSHNYPMLLHRVEPQVDDGAEAWFRNWVRPSDHEYSWTSKIPIKSNICFAV